MSNHDLSIFIKVKENMTTAMKRVDKSLRTLDSGVQKSSQALGKMSRTVFSLKGALVGLGVGLLGREFLNTAQDMEVYQAQMETALGSASAAAEQIEWIKKFAATTPYEIGGLVEASVKLENYGIRSKEVMRTLGDTAGALGKNIGMAVEAMADAQTGEFERLKEFGIKSIQQAGKTYFLYVDKHGKEQRALIDRNNREMITSTLTAIWNEKYAGGMDRMSKTWRGMWSNIKDWFTQFQTTVMDTGVFAFLKEGLQNLLGWLNQMKEKGRVDIWANKMGKAMIKAFSFIAKVAANLPLVFHVVSEAIKKVFAVFIVATNAVLKVTEITLRGLGLLALGLDNPYTRLADKIKTVIDGNDELAVSALQSADASHQAAEQAAQFASDAESAIDGLKDETLSLADARLQDAAATREQTKAEQEKGDLAPGKPQLKPKPQAGQEQVSPNGTIAPGFELLFSGGEKAAQKLLDQTASLEEQKAAILDEYRLRRMEADGQENEAALEQMRQRHEQELESLRQLGASKVDLDQVQARQRLELERTFQGQRAAAVATGINAVAKFFPKMKGLQLMEGLINAKGAIVKAWNSAPFPLNLGPVAAVTASVMPLISAMRSTGPGGGGAMGGRGGGGTNSYTYGGASATVSQAPAKPATNVTINVEGGTKVMTPEDQAEMIFKALEEHLKETGNRLGSMEFNVITT